MNSSSSGDNGIRLNGVPTSEMNSSIRQESRGVVGEECNIQKTLAVDLKDVGLWPIKINDDTSPLLFMVEHVEKKKNMATPYIARQDWGRVRDITMCWKCFDCFRAHVEDVQLLDYQHCMLNDVPVEVFTYERTLEELYLQSNRIRDLPRPLFHCHGLKTLSLSDNDILNLPPAIASLINLRRLDLSKNDLDVQNMWAQCSDGVSNIGGPYIRVAARIQHESPTAMCVLLPALTMHILIMLVALCGIPDNIKCCKQLFWIDVSVNPLEKLPEGFTQLINLEELYLNDTYLDFLPANFGRLTKLKILELRENNLNTLPKSIARLSHLERLDIGQNEFSDLF
uniref:Uncharacterized protein n=1 Tax=Timema monikensis TaxID=170555 RepID=A0A7R9E3T9_9NEOP|nr:unnamed protein product [Timema monikensis]